MAGGESGTAIFSGEGRRTGAVVTVFFISLRFLVEIFWRVGILLKERELTPVTFAFLIFSAAMISEIKSSLTNDIYRDAFVRFVKRKTLSSGDAAS